MEMPGMPATLWCFHPNAVYLNGSGEELEASDGTGAWWVKHSWIVDGEGYINCELFPPQQEYENCMWAEGVMLEDGVSISMNVGEWGEPGAFNNIRRPLLDERPITYEVTGYAPANTDPAAGEVDLTPTVQFVLTFDCVEEPSAFDNRARPCPKIAE
jgi:hypothetical protein